MLQITADKKIKTYGLAPSEPLWRRAPTRDEFGLPVSDFRMLISGLKKRPCYEIKARVEQIQYILRRHQDIVLFADLNLKINLLWVSVRSEAHQDMNIAAEIHNLIPEAKLLTDAPPRSR